LFSGKLIKNKSTVNGQLVTLFDGVLNVASILALHLILVAWFIVLPSAVPIWLFIVLTPLVCLLHQRYMSEWFHEATHFNLLPHRAWNDFLTDLLIGVLVGTRVSTNRGPHFTHHGVGRFFDERDPDTLRLRAANRKELFCGVLGDICGYNAISLYLQTTFSTRPNCQSSRKVPSKGWWLSNLFITHLAGFAATVHVGRLDIYPVYYVTLVCLYPVLNRVRLYGQHAKFLEDGTAVLIGSEVSRNLMGSWVDRIFFNSAVMAFHLEHHRQAYLPYRALRAQVQSSTDPNQCMPGCISVVIALLRGMR